MLRPGAVALAADTHIDIYVPASSLAAIVVQYIPELRGFSMPGDMVPPPTLEGPGYLVALCPPHRDHPPFFVTIDEVIASLS